MTKTRLSSIRLSRAITINVETNSKIDPRQVDMVVTALGSSWKSLHPDPKNVLCMHWKEKSPRLVIVPLQTHFPVVAGYDGTTVAICSKLMTGLTSGIADLAIGWLFHCAATFPQGSYFSSEFSLLKYFYPFVSRAYDFDPEGQLASALSIAAEKR